jgi:UDP-N-acetylmuramoyl-tripeptide--D-alanyl-D-alanine ligase
MRGWDAERIAQAAGAELLSRPPDAGNKHETAPGPLGVTIDSRAVSPGALFVGVRGERADGGAYAAQALAAGAWGVLATPAHAKAAAAALPARTGTAAILAHRDPLAGLQALARSWLGELRADGARVVAITGSTGKTSTKDILATLLAADLRTAASPANFNTEIGLPLAILGAGAGTEALVLELAMRGPGQIAQLTEIARPDVGVIVNVGPVHLELLGSLEAVAAAKAELIAALAPGATAVVPAEEPLLDAHRREDLRMVAFGAGGDIELIERGADGRVVIADRLAGAPARIVLRPSFSQAHNITNLLAAVAAARSLGITPAGEVDVRFSALRGERLQLGDGIVLIDDCYNANPMSMRAAIDELAGTAAARRVAVLGDMLELGARERDFHREIGAYARAAGVQLLVTVGPLAAEMAGAFAGEAGAARQVADADAAAALLGALLRPGDAVLVKGSRALGLERIGQALSRAPARAHAHAGGG